MGDERMYVAPYAQSKRETAQVLYCVTSGYRNAGTRVMVMSSAALSSNRAAVGTPYRYPSPDRPAYSPCRSITVFRRSFAKIVSDIGYHCVSAITAGIDRAGSFAVQTTEIGLRLCKRHQSSLRQLQYLVWRVASTMTQSAALRAQQVALLPRKFWALTLLAQPQLALPQAYSAMTQASAAKKNTHALTGRANSKSRCWGNPLTAVFLMSGDKRPCSRKF